MRWLGREVAESVATMRDAANHRHATKVAMLEDVIYDLDRPMMERLRAVDAHTRAEARHAAVNGLNAPIAVALSGGVQAAMHDALAELDTLVLGTVVARSDEPIPDEPAAVGWDPEGV